jgi:hypothetical protein
VSPIFITRLCKNPFGARSSAVDDRFCVIYFHSFSVADLPTLFKRNAAKKAYRRTSTLLANLTQAIIRNLLDVVHQAIQVPLGVYFALASERESIQSLVVLDVGKYRFHRSNAFAV